MLTFVKVFVFRDRYVLLQQLSINQTKRNFESVTLRRFQNFSWFGFEGKAL